MAWLIQGSVSQNTSKFRGFIYVYDASPSLDWKILNKKTKLRAIPLVDTTGASYDWDGTVSNMLMNINGSIKNNYGSFNSDTNSGWTYPTTGGSPTGRIAENILEQVSPGYYEIDVPHNVDGTKLNCVIAGSFSLPSGGWGPGNFSVSGQINLPTIPLASEITAIAANIEEATTININKNIQTAVSTLRYEFPSGDATPLTGTIVEGTDQVSYGWELPSSFYAKIPNLATAKCKIYCDTYNNGELVGTKSCEFNANVNPVTNAPDVSAVITDSNANTIALTGDNTKIVKYGSNAHIVITATPKNSASIASYKAECLDGKSSNQADITLNAVESGGFKVTVIDSRGISKIVEYSKDLIDYTKLTVNSDFFRNTPTDGKVKLSYTGNYFNGSFGVQNNTLEVKYRYREKGTSIWSSLYSLTPIISGNSFSDEAIMLAPGGIEESFDSDLQWEFELWAYDEFYTSGVKSPDTVNPGIPIWDVGKDDFVHNTDVFFMKNIDVSESIKIAGVDIFEPLPDPIRSDSTTVNNNITATGWGTRIPNGISDITFVTNRDIWVMVTLQSWWALSGTYASSQGRADVVISGATTKSAQGEGIGQSMFMWAVNTTSYMQGNMQFIIKLNAGTNILQAQAYRVNTNTYFYMNYSSMQITPLRWA